MQPTELLAALAGVAERVADETTPAGVLECAARETGRVLGCRTVFYALSQGDRARGGTLDVRTGGVSQPWEGPLPADLLGGDASVVVPAAQVGARLGIDVGGASVAALAWTDTTGATGADSAGLLVLLHDGPVDDEGFVARFASALAAYAGREVRRVRVLEAERRARAETESLLRLTEAANRAQFLGEVYEPALDAVTQVMQVERASILLFDPDDVMRFKAWRGLSDAYRAAVEGHTPWSRDTFDPPPFVVEDVNAHATLAGYLPTFEKEDIRGLAFIPLAHKGTLLGKFMLYERAPRAYTEHELRLAQTIAALVAVTVVRTQLFEAEERHGTELAEVVEEQRRAVRMRDEFLVVAGHELKTPLTALTLQCRLLARAADEPTTRARADRIGEVVRRMGRLVNELLDVSSLSTRKLAIEREMTDLGDVVGGVLSMMAQELEDARVQVRFAQKGAARGFWDRLRLEQVVTNLLSNAAKFGHGRPVDVVVDGTGEVGTLLVRDHGLGIPLADQPRIFEKFERAVSTRHYGGLGIGLWVTREIVEALGGTIHVSSAPGAGAAFRIELPLVEAALEDGPLPADRQGAVASA